MTESDSRAVRTAPGETGSERVTFWDSCSGCTESVDGCINTKDHPPHPQHGVPQGAGCTECGGTGVVFQDWGTVAQLETWAKEMALK